MIQIRRSAERGSTRLPWLESRHTFSFGEYHDPEHVAFGPLRVINDDVVAPASGFGAHPHRDMEILTWVLEGELAHRDSLGTGSTIRPGEAQIMSAGTGIVHSEMNPSARAPVRLLQIWILPSHLRLTPRYEQRAFDLDAAAGQLVCIARPAGTAGGSESARRGEIAGAAGASTAPVTIFQDVLVWVARLRPGSPVAHRLAAGRRAWIQMARGGTALGSGVALQEGDGVAVADEAVIELRSESAAELLLFDLPADDWMVG